MGSVLTLPLPVACPGCVVNLSLPSKKKKEKRKESKALSSNPIKLPLPKRIRLN
jgi:hypothetical protein